MSDSAISREMSDSNNMQVQDMTILDKFYIWVGDYVTNFIQDTLIMGVVKYNNAKIRTTIALRNIRREYFVLDGLLQFFESIFGLLGWIWIYCTHYRLEPSSPEWVCVTKYGTFEMLYTQDKYQKIRPSEDYPELFELTFKTMCKDFDTRRSGEESGIIIGSYSHNKTIVRMIGPVIPEVDLNALVVSPVDFLSIEYRCGDYPSVPIQVPKSHYLVGNQILSKEYILRYLEHLPIYCQWHYAESYQLALLDDNLNNQFLTSTQFIEFTENGYAVKTVDELTNAPNDLVTESKDKIE